MDTTEPTHYLTPGARFIRGFKRIGLTVAIPIVVIGPISSIAYGYSEANDDVGRYNQMVCMSRIKAKGALVGEWISYTSPPRFEYYPDNNGCEGPHWRVSENEIELGIMTKPDWLASFAPIAGIGTLASIAAALFAYFGSWVLGWVIAGFTRDA